MEAPPDIRVTTRREKLTVLLHTVKRARANKLIASGINNMNDEDWQAALKDLEECEEILIELDDAINASQVGSMKAMCLYALGRFDEAAKELKTVIANKRKLKLDEGMASDLLGLGEIMLKKRMPAKANKAFQEALEVFQRLRIPDGEEKARDGLKRASDIS